MMRHLLMWLDILPRSIIVIASAMGWNLHHMDVNTNSLNGIIEEEVYIEQPEGFGVHGKESHVCKMKNELYGLKQAPRAWYGRRNGFLASLGFTKSDADPNLYYKVVNELLYFHKIIEVYLNCIYQ